MSPDDEAAWEQEAEEEICRILIESVHPDINSIWLAGVVCQIVASWDPDSTGICEYVANIQLPPLMMGEWEERHRAALLEYCQRIMIRAGYAP